MPEQHAVAGVVASRRHDGRAATWVRRYAPAELLALIGALAGYLALELATGSHVAAAYGAAIGDGVGYYGLIVTREVRAKGARPAVRFLVLEFGPAEVLDSTVIRPGCTALATAALGTALGVLAGKVLADLVFYLPVIMSYELQGGYREHGR
jgi:hypothetical protein